MVTEEGCGYLCSALSSNPVDLRELELNNSDPQEITTGFLLKIIIMIYLYICTESILNTH